MDRGTTVNAEVVVIGLGAMGSSVLYQLAKTGHSAIGIDRHDPPHAFGSSHGETRVTRLAIGEGAEFIPLVAKSHEIWRELEAEIGETLLVQCGALMIGPGSSPTMHHGKADFVRHTTALALERGIPHETLDADEMRRRYPVLSGLKDGDIGYFEPSAGYVFPERIIGAELAMARKAGARTMPDTVVRSIDRSGGGIRVDTSNGTVTADRVIVAAGTWTGPLLGGVYDRNLKVRRQLLHWFETEPEHLDALRALPVVIWQHGTGNEDYFYSFPVLPGDDRFKAASEQYAHTCLPDELDRDVRPDEPVVLYEAHLRGRVAGVGPTPVRSAVCAYAVTPDHGFIIDLHPDNDRIHVISACSGHGFKHSGGIGHAVVRALQDPEDRDTAFAVSRYV